MLTELDRAADVWLGGGSGSGAADSVPSAPTNTSEGLLSRIPLFQSASMSSQATDRSKPDFARGRLATSHVVAASDFGCSRLSRSSHAQRSPATQSSHTSGGGAHHDHARGVVGRRNPRRSPLHTTHRGFQAVEGSLVISVHRAPAARDAADGASAAAASSPRKGLNAGLGVAVQWYGAAGAEHLLAAAPMAAPAADGGGRYSGPPHGRSVDRNPASTRARSNVEGSCRQIPLPQAPAACAGTRCPGGT